MLFFYRRFEICQLLKKIAFEKQASFLRVVGLYGKLMLLWIHTLDNALMNKCFHLLCCFNLELIVNLIVYV
ncbi:hypothetical protein T06_2077 [Trichinella sp. T6]|nr:hypothetical protein T06_2077 [Trichinella sp. T6]